jgi:hypothetical protein
LWQAGKTVRSLRPENQKTVTVAENSSSIKEVFRKQALKSESIG